MKVWEVLHDTYLEGPTGDGTVIARFRGEHDARDFASRQTCYGRPAAADSRDVSRRLARRWGLA